MSRRDVTVSVSVNVVGRGGEAQKLTANLKTKAVCSEMAHAPPEFLERESFRLGNQLEQEMRTNEQSPTFWVDFARTLLKQVKAYDESPK